MYVCVCVCVCVCLYTCVSIVSFQKKNACVCLYRVNQRSCIEFKKPTRVHVYSVEPRHSGCMYKYFILFCQVKKMQQHSGTDSKNDSRNTF